MLKSTPLVQITKVNFTFIGVASNKLEFISPLYALLLMKKPPYFFCVWENFTVNNAVHDQQWNHNAPIQDK